MILEAGKSKAEGPGSGKVFLTVIFHGRRMRLISKIFMVGVRGLNLSFCKKTTLGDNSINSLLREEPYGLVTS
jgi:hypothetical protein